MTPTFSIIIPVYNRATLVGRAIESCLRQDERDFEIIAVDDGSTDDSIAAVRRYELDPRVRSIVADRNRGRCPSRNLGMEHARGRWFLFLDSDDELVPGALSLVRRRIDAVPGTVSAIRFMCIGDRGESSPEPPHRDERLDYAGFLRWTGQAVAGIRSEALPVVRASTFPAARYAEGHADEGRYHLDIARLGETVLATDVVRIYHDDAPNRVMHADPRRILSYAQDTANDVDETLRNHGAALREHAPALYEMRLIEGVTQHFLAGHRLAALGYAARLLVHPRVWPRLAAVVPLGMLGPRALAWGKMMRMRTQQEQAR